MKIIPNSPVYVNIAGCNYKLKYECCKDKWRFCTKYHGLLIGVIDSFNLNLYIKIGIFKKITKEEYEDNTQSQSNVY